MHDPNRLAAAQASGAETITEASTQSVSPAVPARRKPKISDTPPPAPPAPKLADYEPIIGKSQLGELRFVAQPLEGKRVKMVNSTAVGGGVAEMLNRLVPLLDELGVKTGW
jgi:trehalose synthase-like protein